MAPEILHLQRRSLHPMASTAEEFGYDGCSADIYSFAILLYQVSLKSELSNHCFNDVGVVLSFAFV